jgi:hypothetical protein
MEYGSVLVLHRMQEYAGDAGMRRDAGMACCTVMLYGVIAVC